MNFEIQRNFEPKKTVLSVSYRYVTLFNILFSVLSLVVAFIVGASLHYDQLTTTSCYRASNFLPTMSKLMGDNLPERYIVRICVSLTAFPSFLDGIMMYSFLAGRAGAGGGAGEGAGIGTGVGGANAALLRKWWYKGLNKLTLLVYWIQVFLLLSTVYLSSYEHMRYHVRIWLLFFKFSFAHMILLMITFAVSRERPFHRKDRKSLKIRVVTFALHILGVYLFYYYTKKHMKCEDNAYSYGALSEYLIFGSKLAFHAAQIIDLPSARLTLFE